MNISFLWRMALLPEPSRQVLVMLLGDVVWPVIVVDHSDDVPQRVFLYRDVVQDPIDTLPNER